MYNVPKRFFLVASGVILASLVLEFFLRFAIPQQTYSNSFAAPYSFNCFQEGEYYWIALKPNSECILKSNVNAFRDSVIKANSLGLRNPEITIPKPEGVKRILFIGDSFTIGWGVDEERAFPRVVESLLSEDNKIGQVETINAGMTAAGPGFYYTFLKHQGLSLNPDIVVVGLYLLNDIPENALFSDWLEVDSQGLPEKIASIFNYVDSASGYIFSKNTPGKYKIPLFRESHLFAFIADRFPQNQPDYTIQISDARICLYKEECHQLDEAKARTKKLLLAMKNLLSEKSKKLLIVFIPAEFQSNIKSRIKYVSIPLFPAEKEYPYNEFKQFFAENNIDYLDLRPAFKESGEQDSYYKRDDHWNNKGHQIAARAISEKLIELLK